MACIARWTPVSGSLSKRCSTPSRKRPCRLRTPLRRSCGTRALARGLSTASRAMALCRLRKCRCPSVSPFARRCARARFSAWRTSLGCVRFPCRSCARFSFRSTRSSAMTRRSPSGGATLLWRRCSPSRSWRAFSGAKRRSAWPCKPKTARLCRKSPANLRENRFIPSMARCMTRRKSMRSPARFRPTRRTCARCRLS